MLGGGGREKGLSPPYKFLTEILFQAKRRQRPSEVSKIKLENKKNELKKKRYDDDGDDTHDFCTPIFTLQSVSFLIRKVSGFFYFS